MTPIVAELAASISDLAHPDALWWALALGADFGGNLTAVGASANVVMLGIARRAEQSHLVLGIHPQGRDCDGGLDRPGGALLVAALFRPRLTLAVIMIVERKSIVDAPRERVWQRIVTPEGINDELRPWMTMSMPRGQESLTVDTVPVGTPVGHCWMRLFGVAAVRLRPLDHRPVVAGSRLRRGVDDAQHAAAGATSAPSNPTATPKPLSATVSRSSFGVRYAC